MKRLKIILLLGCIASGLSGQFYVQPSAGYSFSSHPHEMHSILIVDNLKSVYTMKIRFGETMNAGLTLGYVLWDNFFLELNARMAVLARHTASVEPPDLQSLDNFSISGFFGEMEYSSPVFQFAPQIGYKVRKDKFSAYFSVGPNFMDTKIKQTSKQVVYIILDNDLYPLDAAMKYEYSGGLHTGLQADLGLCYSFRPNLQLVMDFVTVCNNYKITRGEITGYELEGIDQMETLDDTEIEIYPGDERLNHSHYGVSVGLRYVFGRR